MAGMNDGGPAFPFTATGISNIKMQTNGMTLRDWFAGQALASIISACKADTCKPGEDRGQMFARKAYEIADSMIEARNK